MHTEASCHTPFEEMYEWSNFLNEAGVDDSTNKAVAEILHKTGKTPRDLRMKVEATIDVTDYLSSLDELKLDKTIVQTDIDKIKHLIMTEAKRYFVNINEFLEIRPVLLEQSFLNSPCSSPPSTVSRHMICPHRLELWEDFDEPAVKYLIDSQLKVPPFNLEQPWKIYSEKEVLNEFVCLCRQINKALKYMYEESVLLLSRGNLGPNLELEINRSDGKIQIVPIEIETFWTFPSTTDNVDLIDTFYTQKTAVGDDPRRQQDAYRGICQLFGYQLFNKSKYGLLSTYNSTYFVKYDQKADTLLVTRPYRVNSGQMLRAFLYFVNLCVQDHVDLTQQNFPSITIQQLRDLSMTESSNIIGVDYHINAPQGIQDALYLENLMNVIGSGSSGIVMPYKNFSTEFPMTAMKIVRLSTDPRRRSEIELELKVYERLKSLQGVCIPRILGVWYAYPFVFVAMTLIDTQRLVNLEEENDASIVAQIDAIKESLRSLGVVHLDFEHIGNILLDKDGKVWLIDFGQARIL